MTFHVAVPVIDAITGSVEAVEKVEAAWQNLPGPEGVVPVAVALAAGVMARWLWFGHDDQRDRFDRIRRRHDELHAITAKLHEASHLVRLFTGTSAQYRTLNQHFADVMEAAERLGSQVTRAEQELGTWRVHKARHALGLLERNMRDLERDLKTVQHSLKGLSDDNQECAQCLSTVRTRRVELLKAAARPEVGWAADLRAELEALEAAIEHTETLQTNGDLVLALQHCRDVSQALQRHRRLLDSRAMTLRWLRAVPEHCRRLKLERERLERLGFRSLPEIDDDRLCKWAEDAIDQLYAGELEAVASAQHALRHEMDRLRRGLTGREELWWANNRELRALRTDFQTMEAQLPALRPTGVIERYPARLWQAAEREEADVRKLLARLWESLMTAEGENALTMQRFDQARDMLRQAGALRGVIREELARTAELWNAPAREEARLRGLLVSLLGEAGAAHAQARHLGMAQDPRVEALLFAARSALDAEVPALEEAERTLESAHQALMRYRDRLTDLQERLEPAPKRAGPVVFLRQNLESPEDSPTRRR